MSKDKNYDKEQIAQLMDDIEKEHGEGSIFYLGDEKENKSIDFVDTGIDEIDRVMGGGLPKGRIIELYGPENAGKTSLAHYWQAQFDLAMHIDAEGSFVGDRARFFGNESGQLIVKRPEWGEQIIDLVIKAAKAGTPLITVDSVPSIIPKEQVEESDRGKQNVASTARLLSRWMFKIASEAEKSGSIIVFINQIRDNIGGNPWAPPHTPGGHALKHYASLKIQLNRKKWLKMGDDYEGQLLRLRTYKSKVCAPRKECEVGFIYDKAPGFVNGGEKETRKIIRKIRKKRRKNKKDDNDE